MVLRRKLLFISPCTPDPQGTGSEQRAFAFLSAYSKFMDVELWFSPTLDNPELLRLGKLTRHCISLTAFYPVMLGDERSGLRTRLIQSLSRSDVVHVFRLHQMVSVVNHKCLVWDIDEVPWLASRQTSTDRAQQLSELYSNCFKKCRKVFASSRLVSRQAHFDDIAIIPNIAIDPELSNFESSGKTPILLFVGNLNHPANTDGLIFFSDSILPDLAGAIPGVLVNVVGRSPVKEDAWASVNHLRNTSAFRFVFDVPCCTPYYLQAVASIVPILAGGGTRIKIIESFAHHCPVISTTKGCEGLEVGHREHLLIADSPKDFASACVELIQNPKLGKQLAETAYSLFERNHSQKVVDGLLFSALENLT